MKFLKEIFSPLIILFLRFNFLDNRITTGPYNYIIDRGVETLVEEGWLYIFN
jgi:hypothetical protein